MKYYYGFFRDTNTSSDPEGRLYKVVIKTKKGEGVEELLFSSSPFTVSYENSSELYKPYKCSSAVVGLLNKEYNDDFVCESIKDNEVYLYKLNEGVKYTDELKNESSDSKYFTLEWCGYTTPDVYSQGYNSYLDEFELECQDKLSILKYYKWDDITHVDLNDDGKINIYSILFYISLFLKVDEFLISKSLRIPNLDNYELRDYDYSIILKTYILESTLYEDEESKYLSDILENILSYLSLTAIQINNKMYIVNYNAIATGFSDYFYLNFKTAKTGNKDINKVYSINADDSAANDTSLSVIESYDDFVINTETSEIDRSYPNIEWYNKTPSTYIDEMYSTCSGRIAQARDISSLTKYADWDGYSVYQQLLGHTIQGYTSIQFYNFNKKDKYYSPDIKFYGYEADVRVNKDEFITGDKIENYVAGQCCLTGDTASIRNRVSAMPISYGLIKDEDWQKQVDGSHEDGIFLCHPVSNAEDMTDDEWLNRVTSWIFLNSQPMVDITYRNVILTPEHPLCWKADIQYFADYIPCCFEPSSKVLRAWDRFNVAVMLKTSNGTFYYDDVNHRWSTGVVILHPSIGVAYNDDIYGKKLKLKNNRVNGYNVSKYEDGIVIDSYGDNYQGDITIRIYRQFGPDSSFAHITSSTLITGIDLEYLNKRNIDSKFVSDSTKVEYKDANKFINSVNAEELKYTSTTANPNIDNNIYTRDENGEFVTLDYILDIPSGDVFRCEEHRLRDKVKQFLVPSLSLQSTNHCNVDMITKVDYHRFSDKTFVVNGLEIDYGNDSRTINILEKK